MLIEEGLPAAMSGDRAVEGQEAEASPEGQSADAVVETDPGALAGLREALGELVVELREQNAIARDRERVIDRLHAENQSLRLGELQAAMAPLFKDLITLHDDLDQTASRYEHPAPDASLSASQDFRSFCQVLLDILARFGVERFDAEPVSPYNAREHRAVRSVPTAEMSQDRCIAEVIRCGFRSETRVMRPLEAVVMTFRPSPPHHPTSAQ